MAPWARSSLVRSNAYCSRSRFDQITSCAHRSHSWLTGAGTKRYNSSDNHTPALGRLNARLTTPTCLFGGRVLVVLLAGVGHAMAQATTLKTSAGMQRARSIGSAAARLRSGTCAGTGVVEVCDSVACPGLCVRYPHARSAARPRSAGAAGERGGARCLRFKIARRSTLIIFYTLRHSSRTFRVAHT